MAIRCSPHHFRHYLRRSIQGFRPSPAGRSAHVKVFAARRWTGFSCPAFMRPHIVEPAASPKPVGPYSHAVRVGDFLFCSGQIPLTKEGKIVEGGIREQTRQVLQNLSAILQDQAVTFESVVKTTVFLIDLAEFAEMNAVYAEFFRTNFPARSTIQVAAL